MLEFLGISYLEWLGYAASIIVFVSLSMTSIVKLRWYNMLGAALFSTYGFFIGSYPVAFMNFLIVCTNIYYLVKMYQHKENFKVIEIKGNDEILNYYLESYKKDIAKFFPDFTSAEGKLNVFVLRDMSVAGIFIGEVKDDIFKIDVDYALPQFRDFKVANYLYQKLSDILSQHDVKCIVCDSDIEDNLKYIKKMGFETCTREGKEVMCKSL
ncbi:YgjV family protein [Ancylomarina salipaludis]|nr:YgjV family protein [Ancylomarina salipaludis]